MNTKTALDRFRIIALVEGISYLLFAITMPLKYVWEIPEPNYVVGMIHGILFISYMLLGLQLAIAERWKFGFSLLVAIAGFLPFGTFYLDAKYLKPMRSVN